MTTPQLPPLPEQSMTHHITDEQILTEAARHLGEMHVENCGLGDIKAFARAVLALAAQAPQGEPLGYIPTDAIDQIKGPSRLITHKVPVLSYAAEGYTAIYTAPAPAPAPAPAVPSGWKLVPVEPTEAMLTAGALAHKQSPAHDFEGPIHDAWSAMLTAAPTPPAQPAVPESADSGQAAQEYGDTYLPWGFTVCRELEPQEKRLMSMLIKAFGSGHPAIDDMAHLILTRCGPAQQQPAVPEDVARLDALGTPGWELSMNDDPECGPDELWQVHRVSGGRNDREWTLIGSGANPRAAIDAARKAGGAA